MSMWKLNSMQALLAVGVSSQRGNKQGTIGSHYFWSVYRAEPIGSDDDL